MKAFRLLFLALFIIGCSEKNDVPNPIQLVDYEKIMVGCHSFRDTGNFIIQTKEELFDAAKNILGDSLWTECIDTTDLPVNFEEDILLGKLTKQDKNDNLNKFVYKAQNPDRIVYRIELDTVAGPPTYGGYGNIRSVGMNWIIIQRPPANVEVSIEYIEY